MSGHSCLAAQCFILQLGGEDQAAATPGAVSARTTPCPVKASGTGSHGGPYRAWQGQVPVQCCPVDTACSSEVAAGTACVGCDSPSGEPEGTASLPKVVFSSTKTEPSSTAAWLAAGDMGLPPSWFFMLSSNTTSIDSRNGISKTKGTGAESFRKANGALQAEREGVLCTHRQPVRDKVSLQGHDFPLQTDKVQCCNVLYSML